jgi:ubiquinone/menaquinone biosynthesis C-methylase UbiE
MTSQGPRKADPQRITNLASAFCRSSVLFAASELGIFTAISHSGKSDCPGLAAALNLNPRWAALLLDACVAIGLLEKDGEFYRNSPDVDNFLIPGGAVDLTAALRGIQDVYCAWNRLSDFVRLGSPVMAQRSQSREGHPDHTAADVLSMHARALAMGRSVVRRLDLRSCKNLLDIGGGSGTYSALISLEFPHIHCTVLDLPEVTKIGSALIAQQGASHNVSMLAGDYHTTALPPDNDVILLFDILHQESPEAIQDLLNRAVRVLRPGGVVYVMDMMTDDTHTAPAVSALFALNLALTAQAGWVFSYSELKGWMEQAGLSGFSIEALPPPAPHWLARARKLA